VWEVSNPKNEEYGQYWSREEILNLVSPPESEREVVLQWLRSENPSPLDIIDLKDMTDAIRVVANVRYVEKLFTTKMMRYTHTKTGKLLSFLPSIHPFLSFLSFFPAIYRWFASFR
jgi:hypothetical protein